MYRLVLSIFSVFLFTLHSMPQETQLMVRLVKKSDPQAVSYLQEGKRIGLTTQAGYRVSGNMSLPNDSMIIVSDKSFLLTDIRFIQSSGASRTAKKVFGGFLGVAGLMLAGAGFTVIMDAVSSNSTKEFIILIPLGLITSGIGIAATLKGVSNVFGNENEFDVQHKWNIGIIPESEISKE